MPPMAAGLPQLDVEDIGRDDLLEAPRAVLLPDEGHQCIVDMRPAGQEEARAGGELVEEEQLLFLEDIIIIFGL